MFGSTTSASSVANPQESQLFQGFRLVASGLTLLVVMASPLAPLQGQEPYDRGETYRSTPVPDRIVLTLTTDPATSQAVTWRTDMSVEKPVAQIALAMDGPRFETPPSEIVADSQVLKSNRGEAQYHSVVFTELTPDTKYMYRVGDGVNWSEWNHFITASDKPQPFTFIYFGDAQNDIKARWSRVVREAYTEAPRADFMLHAGDLINIGTADEEWGEWFEAGGWIYRTMPSIATPGNHEYYTFRDADEPLRGVTPHWNATFALPTNGPEGQEGLSETAYHLNYQNALIVSIDSNRDLGVQAEWLDQVLEENEQTWKIVTMHHPVYSAAANRDNPAIRGTFQPIFDKHGVDIVLQGHDHTYARSRLVEGLEPAAENVPTGRTAREGKGTLYVVSVSGPKMYDLGDREVNVRSAEDTQLFQVIRVEQNKLIYEARTAKGMLYDAFELVKKKGEPNQLINKIPDVPERRRE